MENYFGILTLITILLLIETEIMAVEDSKENLSEYYTCYFNKYFQRDPNSEDVQRDAFVDQVVNDALANDEPVPSGNCVQWVCDERVLWKISNEESIEVLAYYALQNNSISSWQACLDDEAEEFVRRNYTNVRAGWLTVWQHFYRIS